jgi:alcohol dehydrogenase class IV
MGISVGALSTSEAADAMIENLYTLISDLNIALTLRDKGITEADLDFLVAAAAKVTRLLDNNPKLMTKDDIRAIYQKLL